MGQIILPHRRKHHRGGLTEYTAKSVVYDFADAHGSVFQMWVRQFDFLDSSLVKIPLVQADYSASATTSFGSMPFWGPPLAFDTSLAVTGISNNKTWASLNPNITNQRLIIVLNTPLTFYGMDVVNGHSSGSVTDRGVNNTKIQISSDAIVDNTYNAAVANSSIIYNSVVREHNAVDEADRERLVLI